MSLVIARVREPDSMTTIDLLSALENLSDTADRVSGTDREPYFRDQIHIVTDELKKRRINIIEQGATA